MPSFTSRLMILFAFPLVNSGLLLFVYKIFIFKRFGYWLPFRKLEKLYLLSSHWHYQTFCFYFRLFIYLLCFNLNAYAEKYPLFSILIFTEKWRAQKYQQPDKMLILREMHCSLIEWHGRGALIRISWRTFPYTQLFLFQFRLNLLLNYIANGFISDWSNLSRIQDQLQDTWTRTHNP